MLAAEALGFRYPKAASAALDSVSLGVSAGEVLGLLGPNGAGKSTLIALLAGVIVPSTGRVQRDATLSGAGRVAWVPQDFAFYPMLTARENLAVFAGVLGLHGAACAARIERAIAYGQLAAFVDRGARTLSGGMKRRLNLALALLGDPAVLLLDEPTAGVDPQSRAFLLDTVRALRDEGRAVIYTSHYMEEIEAVADRVAILDHGRVLAEGTLDAVCAMAGTHARIAVGGPLPAPLAQDWQKHFTLAAIGPQTWSLQLGAPEDLAGVLEALRRHNVPLRSAQCGRATLEDVFLQLTQRALRDDA
ncbi:ABC transporter ATP-binding protein [Niveibacterium sp.]|uniref:ABC transporter ATP-binding protein n=1 Tax=Niveibacterium sp. TaxID=2017444 RepID=UPI0035B4D515